MIHRDIKPQNVLVPHRTEHGAPAPEAFLAAAKLTDFGGASLVGEDALTRTGDVLGTLAYMAPEQSEGREVGVQADLYSAGARALRGAVRGQSRSRPHAGRHRAAHRPAAAAAGAQRAGICPLALTRALDRALAPAPGDRGTLEELRLALEETLERRPETPAHPWAQLATAVRAARTSCHPGCSWHRAPRAHPAAPALPCPRPAALSQRRRIPAGPPRGEHAVAEQERGSPPRRLALPRAVWLACAAGADRLAGVRGASRRRSAGLRGPRCRCWCCPASGARRAWERAGLRARWRPCSASPASPARFPRSPGRRRAGASAPALAALGYWWLALAEPLLDRRLWLGQPAGTPARAAWEGSLSATAAHVIAPLLVLGVLLGALLWGAGAVALPWIVRGRSAVLDVVAVTVWSAAIAAAAPALDAGLTAHAAHPSPRGAVLGAILGGVIAVAARALRGPV